MAPLANSLTQPDTDDYGVAIGIIRRRCIAEVKRRMAKPNDYKLPDRFKSWAECCTAYIQHDIAQWRAERVAVARQRVIADNAPDALQSLLDRGDLQLGLAVSVRIDRNERRGRNASRKQLHRKGRVPARSDVRNQWHTNPYGER